MGILVGPGVVTRVPTRISITWPRSGAGLETAAGSASLRTDSVLPAKREKSTITSMRSAGRTSRSPMLTGALNRPPSEPICQAGGPPAIRRFQKRALDALRMRKRYIRGSTLRNGCAAPLTTGVSP